MPAATTKAMQAPNMDHHIKDLMSENSDLRNQINDLRADLSMMKIEMKGDIKHIHDHSVGIF